MRGSDEDYLFRVIEDIQKAQVDCGGTFRRHSDIRDTTIGEILSLLVPNNVVFTVAYNPNMEIDK